MKKSLAVVLFLSVSVNTYAVDNGAIFGGAIGGAAGAAVGYNVGGQSGAILGAAIGGATGAAVGSTPPVVQAAPVQAVSSQRVDDNEYRHHDNGPHRGEHRKNRRHEKD